MLIRVVFWAIFLSKARLKILLQNKADFLLLIVISTTGRNLFLKRISQSFLLRNDRELFTKIFYKLFNKKREENKEVK